MELSEEELQTVYTWVDEIPLSRPKRNIARDFSDGVLMAEIVAHYMPRLVELHNYSTANGMQQKLYNWSTLNAKVLRRLGVALSRPDVDALAAAQPGAVERALKAVRTALVAAGISGSGGGDDAVAAIGSPPQQQVPVARGGGGGNAAGVLSPRAGASPAAIISAYAAGRAAAGKLGAAGAGAAAAAAAALAEKEQVIRELREAMQLLHTKADKLEQLVKLKDAKIAALMGRLSASGLMA